jgi:hypothetical protein
MIRLLEIPKLSDSKNFEGGHRHGRVPAIGNVSRLEIHLTSKREAVAAAYLRAAHAYILISMPTGTSTIFGVFQAILALLLNRTNFALPDKLMRKAKFASEIFCHNPLSSYAASQKEFTNLCGPASKQWRINRFRVVCSVRILTSVEHHQGCAGQRTCEMSPVS